MLLIELIALALVIAGIVIITRGSLWAGIALIAVGVLIFLLRNSIDTSGNGGKGAALAATSVIPWLRSRKPLT